MLNCCPKVCNHPRAFLSAKEGSHQTLQTHGQHTYGSRHLECWQGMTSVPHHIHLLLLLWFLGPQKGKVTHTHRCLAVQQKDEERLILSIDLSVFLFLTIYFQWKELEGLLCPGQSSPVCAVQSGLVPPAQLSWSGLVGCSKGTRSYSHPPMQLLGKGRLLAPCSELILQLHRVNAKTSFSVLQQVPVWSLFSPSISVYFIALLGVYLSFFGPEFAQTMFSLKNFTWIYFLISLSSIFISK